MKIAVIGSGIAGLGAAWALQKNHDVTVYEKDTRIGGHAHTVEIDYDGAKIAVDTGFIVYNKVNYPNLTALFGELGVATEQSDMSFAVSAGNGAFEWGSDRMSKVFGQKRNVLRPSFHAMWIEIMRFNRIAERDLDSGAADALALGDYLDLRRFGSSFRRNFILPMGAAIWSTSPCDVLYFPAKSFLQFFRNHGLLSVHRQIAWRTVTGGSREYVKKLIAPFRDRIRVGVGAAAIRRAARHVDIVGTDGNSQRFDHVVLATHSDRSLRLLSDANEYEREILGGVRYAPNRVILHRDERLMPQRKAVWSAWNYMCADPKTIALETGAPSVSYWMNTLQNIDRSRPLFISLNPNVEPDPKLVFAEFAYDHPQYDKTALVAQRRLQLIQGMHNTWYCGAWCGYGFHEDGLTSGLEVAARLGALVPWGEVHRPRIFTAIAEAAE